MPTMRDALRWFMLCVLVACGGVADGDESEATLQIDPAAVELLIANGTPATQSYTATLVFPDGRTRDVTDETVFLVDSGFGSVVGSTVSIRTAGKTQVYGQRDDKIGTAQILARVESTRVDPSLPPNTPDLFGGAEDPARGPTVVYPPADVIVPRNLGDFEAHWIDPHGNDIFELSLRTEFANVRVYVPGGNGLGAAGPMPTFSAFLADEWTSAVGIEPNVTFQVRGVASASPGVVGTTGPRRVKLSNQTLEGGLYYWAAADTSGIYGIYRHDMAKAGQPAEEYMTTNQTQGRCVACHVLSRDGRRMAVTYDGGNGAATTVDVATGTASPDVGRWNFATYSPDARHLLTVFTGIITVRDAADGTPILDMPTSSYVTHPDLSPDGTRLVYVVVPGANPGSGADWSFGGGQIYTRTYDPVTQLFGAETPLVTDGVNNFYPSWSPDGQWILFNRAPGGSAYDNPNAALWVVKADGSAPAVELATVNATLGLTNSWGRWAPFPQTLGVGHEPMYWVTVSSKRDFGVRLIAANRPQIWMTAFFPERATAGEDPTAPAFRLPFQNIEGNNHIAQWTERVVTTQ
jgi:hypothetical protein